MFLHLSRGDGEAETWNYPTPPSSCSGDGIMCFQSKICPPCPLTMMLIPSQHAVLKPPVKPVLLWSKLLCVREAAFRKVNACDGDGEQVTFPKRNG